MNTSYHTVAGRPPPTASSSVVSVPADDAPTRDAVLDESANNNAAHNHPAARGNNQVTGNGARVDSAESDDDTADKEDNPSATTVQTTPGARHWRASGTTTRIRPCVAHQTPTRIRTSAALGHTGTIRLGVALGARQNGCAGWPGILQWRCSPRALGTPTRIHLGAPHN